MNHTNQGDNDVRKSAMIIGDQIIVIIRFG